MTDPASLPTPRALLTSIFTSLSSTQTTNQTPTVSAQTHQISTKPSPDPPTNQLKSLPASHRALLTTLHVLLPTGVLLQSLDLLDRGLVVRVVEHTSPSTVKKETPEGSKERVESTQAHVHLPEASPQGRNQDHAQGDTQAHDASSTVDGGTDDGGSAKASDRKKGSEKARNHIYLVRSSQAPKSRFKDPLSSTSAASLTYTVRLEVWNCSCAAFAFESFPGSSYSGTRAPWLSLDDSDSDSDERGKERGDDDGDGSEVDGVNGKGRGWEFGGLSFDGKEGGKVPVCKHLLACLLVERWEDVFGGYVKERSVEREEMAGVGCEG